LEAESRCHSGKSKLNCNRFTDFNLEGQSPFIEGNVLKMHIPIPVDKRDYETEGLNEGLSEGLSAGLKTLLTSIKEFPGIKAKDLSLKLNNRPIKTIERQMNQLTKLGLVERKGSRKTGGYYITEKIKDE
jgi:hypothetical protein